MAIESNPGHSPERNEQREGEVEQLRREVETLKQGMASLLTTLLELSNRISPLLHSPKDKTLNDSPEKFASDMYQRINVIEYQLGIKK